MVQKKSKRQLILLAFLLPVLLHACVRVRLDAPSSRPPLQDIETNPTQAQFNSDTAPTAIIVFPTRLATESISTAASMPEVTITAVNGNLFIRRGPDMAYNPIGVLYQGISAQAVATDVLSDWAQIVIPDSGNLGWVSLQTKYSKLQGDLPALPDFTPTDWPTPAYLRNCTYHEMYVLPGALTLPSSLGYPENEIWLYPGQYTIYDLEVPGLPDVLKVDIREGVEVEIVDDGLGDHKNCQ